MKVDIKVPQLSESLSSGTLLAWRKQIGDQIQRDETLVDLETDKVILEIPAAASGTLVEIHQPEGAEVTAEQLIAVIETDRDAVTAGDKPPIAKPSAAPAVKVPSSKPATPVVTSSSPPPAATPPRAARQDVTPPPLSPPRPEIPTGTTRREKMSRLRTRIAERLLNAQHNAAMLTTFNEVNMQAVNELRQRYKAEFETRHGVKLGYMSFFVRAVCSAMQQYPVINAAIDGDDIVWSEDIDIGIAVSTPRGLVVPVLRRAQTLSAAQIETAIADFASRAKDMRLKLEELAGGTFSITNGGVFGSLLSTPILNPPQSAILGMHQIQERPVAELGQVVIRPMMYLALTYDHRLVDGREAVQFLVAVKRALETPDAVLV